MIRKLIIKFIDKIIEGYVKNLDAVIREHVENVTTFGECYDQTLTYRSKIMAVELLVSKIKFFEAIRSVFLKSVSK